MSGCPVSHAAVGICAVHACVLCSNLQPKNSNKQVVTGHCAHLNCAGMYLGVRQLVIANCHIC
eukprot:5231265-Amphidinium_carterae.1